MAEILWSIEEAGKNHDVRLRHKYWTGKRQLWLDGELIHTSRKLNSQGFVHRFSLGEKQVEVMITTNGFTYTYFLLVDHRPVPSEAQKTQGITTATLLAHRHLWDLVYWLELADLTGLAYQPLAVNGWFRHRLLGKFNGFPFSVNAVRRQDPMWDAILWEFLTVELPNYKEISPAILQDPEVRQRFAVAGKKTAFTMSTNAVRLGIPFRPKKFPAADMAALVTFLLSRIGLHGGAPAGKVCQLCGETKTLHYAYVNNDLRLLCEDCLYQIEHIEEQALEVVKQTEAEWPKASLKSIALLVAMTFGVAWGISLIPADFIQEYDKIFGILPWLFFAAILLYFPKQLKLINLPATFIMMGLTSIALLAGIFALILGIRWSGSGLDLSWEIMVSVAQKVMETRQSMIWVGLGLLMSGSQMVQYHLARRPQIQRFINPVVEIIDL